MKQHHSNLSKDGPNECPHCKKTVVGINALRLHITRKHRDGQKKCKDCDLVFRNSAERYNHWEQEMDLQFFFHSN